MSGILVQLALNPPCKLYMTMHHSQSTFNKPQQCPTDKITSSILEKCLESSDKTPHNHLNWNPPVRSEFLGQQLRWHFREKENKVEDCLSGVVVVCVHSEIIQHAVRHGLDDIAPVQLEGKEGYACECAYSDIDLVKSVLAPDEGLGCIPSSQVSFLPSRSIQNSDPTGISLRSYR